MTEKSEPESPIHGVVHAFCETGTEGIIWSVQDEKHMSNGKWSYEGLNSLEDGDYLQIFNDASRRKIVWEGEIRLKHPPATKFNRGMQDGVDEREWAQLFFDERPATLIKKEFHEKAKAEQQRREADLADINRACYDGVAVDPMKPLTFRKRNP